MKRHKCIAERQKPVSQQRGAVQCGTCHKWFSSNGGLAVHIDAADDTIITRTRHPLLSPPTGGSVTALTAA